ncbi:glutamate receptor ionotropic, NMDA 3A-like [Actinia tenebrosa]|uniref:Glutamate receptor ionotropic, NMDA 3A-like n=1 Tax=Actinia tenebrosa TaxID=6105 RepID=A0A6P8IV68_ACTTE|nr:glutamate receptor ionotropic, NMDA 3A-like [Actinia tenebrosa]
MRKALSRSSLQWTFFLVFILYVSSSFAIPKIPFNVGILLDKTWNTTNVSFSSVNLQPVILSTHGLGFEEIVTQGCHKFSAKKIVSLIGPEGGLVGGVGQTIAQHFSIPYIGLGMRVNKMHDKHVNLSPTISAQAEAIIGLAIEFGSPCIGIFMSSQDPAGISHEIRKKANSLTLKFNINEVMVGRSVQEYDFLAISREALVMNRSGYCIVVLECGKSMATFIQQVTDSLGIPLGKFLWVTFDDKNLTPQDDVKNVPVGILWMRLSYNWIDLVTDGLRLVDKTLQSQQWTLNSSTVNTSCLQPVTSWIDSKLFFRKMIEQSFVGKTGALSLSSQGQRQTVPYDILRMSINPQGQKFWEEVGSASSTSVHLSSNFWTKNFSHPASNLIRMTTIEDDPVIIVSKGVLKDSEDCTLSQLCIRFERVKIPGTNKTQIQRLRKCCIGYAIDILEHLKKDLGFNVELYFVEDGFYGGYDPKTKTWNGLINELIQGKADMTLTTLTINEVRSRVIDYSNAFLYGETKIMLGQGKKTVNVIEMGFLAPFDTNLWLVSLLAINVTLVVVWLIERFSPYGHFNTHKGRLKYIFDASACMSFIWSSVFKLQLDSVNPRSVSARTTSAVFAFAMLILISTYTANLAASLVTTESQKVSEIRDKKFTDKSSGFKFATLKHSSTEMVFSHSSDPEMRRIYQNMKPYQVLTYAEATQKLNSGELDAFIDDSPFIDLTASKQPDCSFKIVGHAITMHGYGFAFPKNSKWTTPISQLMLKYERRDYFRHLRKKWFTGVCDNSKEAQSKAYRMEFQHFSGLFLVSSIAFVICFALLIVEVFLNRCRRKILTTYNLKQSPNSVRELTGTNLAVIRLSVEALTDNVKAADRRSSTSTTMTI